jgi:hypothetical protein
VLWQSFWLDLCTKQVVSARACANQFLPYSSSGIALFGMRTVQADSCLNPEQIDTLFISVGEAQNLHVTVMIFSLRPPAPLINITFIIKVVTHTSLQSVWTPQAYRIYGGQCGVRTDALLKRSSKLKFMLARACKRFVYQ